MVVGMLFIGSYRGSLGLFDDHMKIDLRNCPSGFLVFPQNLPVASQVLLHLWPLPCLCCLSRHFGGHTK